MYSTLLIVQSVTRWLLLACMFFAIYRAWRGVKLRKEFTRTDNIIRLGTVIFTYMLLLLGLTLYSNSPAVKRFIMSPDDSGPETVFFGVVHGAIMLTAIIFITIGSARTAYLQDDYKKYKSMLFWFSIALLLILIAIPWPFSPFAQRPLIR